MKNLENIYKLHNAEIINEQLQMETEDNSFEFIKDYEYGFLFVNDNNEYVIFNKNGAINVLSVDLKQEFLTACTQRIQKTGEMTAFFN